MKTFLLLRSISEDDRDIFGTNLLTLGKLLRVGLPVAPGIVLIPPEKISKNELKLLSKDNQKLAMPKELDNELKKKKLFAFEGQIFNNKSLLWKEVLKSFLKEDGSKVIFFPSETKKKGPLRQKNV